MRCKGLQEKERIDKLLVKMGFFNSREKAKRAVMAGEVYVDGIIVDKPGTIVDNKSNIHIKGNSLPFVSRGGLKLEKALDVFEISVKGCTVIDIGASTGGFTDCLLKKGAKKVYAVDVGYGQLDWALRNDPRVVCMERTNARYLKPSDFDVEFDMATVDVSFISLAKILPAVSNLIKNRGSIITLIKPQFEAGRSQVGKKGVVKDPGIHQEVIKKTIISASENGLFLKDITFSPIKGPKGNIEFLGYFIKSPQKIDYKKLEDKVYQTVISAHNLLNA
ncbi:MAG: rRNA (cytidine1920-2-O)/16S rRNA (cytidine1409-2-O)-methyltransferase [Thermosediminibacterales bacterium]|nr:rRNA (cytidine1920-2-O)/16S rRNA (cytidine1409-2-O)-methyltransferase [Thermosediminibacterales bacterium]